jgi:hypothetical protein
VTFTAVTGRRTTITRTPGKSLCGKRAWDDREPSQGEDLCPRCVALAERYGVAWPERRTGGAA